MVLGALSSTSSPQYTVLLCWYIGDRAIVLDCSKSSRQYSLSYLLTYLPQRRSWRLGLVPTLANMLVSLCFGAELTLASAGAGGEPDGCRKRISHARWPPRCSLRSTRRLCVRAMHTRIPTSRAESETAAANSPSTRARTPYGARTPTPCTTQPSTASDHAQPCARQTRALASDVREAHTVHTAYRVLSQCI